MTKQRFSRDHGFESEPKALAYDEIPDLVREDILYLVERLVLLC